MKEILNKKLEVREILKSKKLDVDEIIKETLAGSEKTSEELKQEVVEAKGIPYPTFRHHINKLVKRGIIIETGYRLVYVENEANINEVEETIRKLKEINHNTQLKLKTEQLKRLCDGKRIAHFPNVLTFFENALSDPKFSNSDALSNLIGAYRRILYFERMREIPNKRIIDRINKNIGKLKYILDNELEKTPSNIEDIINPPLLNCQLINEIIYFFGETEKSEVIDIIFNLAEKLPDSEFNLCTGIARSLFSHECTLYRKHQRIINRRLDEMVESSDSTVSQRGERLKGEKQSRLIYH